MSEQNPTQFAPPPANDRATAGNWMPRRNGSAVVFCPQCESTFDLDDVEIDDQGKTQSEVECPWDGCVFSDYLLLTGWANFGN